MLKFKKKSGTSTADAVKATKKAEKKLRRKPPTDADRHDRYVLIRRCMRILGAILTVSLSATLVMFMATTAVPISVVALSNLLGVGYDSIGLDIVFVFGMPSLFLVGCWILLTKWLACKIKAGVCGFFDNIAERFNPARKEKAGE